MKTLSDRLLAAAVLTACLAPHLLAQIPDWYTTHKNPRYPSEMYIIGVGAGSGPNAIDAAKKAAQTDLVSQIRVQIQAEMKNVSESFQFNKDEQTFSDFRSKVRTAVSDEITGMEVVETLTDNATGTAYALVVLDRDKYCETLRNEMDAGWKQAADLRTVSVEYANRGRLSDAIQNHLDARKIITPLLTKQALYNVVSNTPYKPIVSFGPTTLASDIRTILTNVKLEKRGGDNQKGRIGEKFPDPFVVLVTLSQDNNTVPVVGSTIVFETSDKTKVGDATTDDQGKASLSTTISAMTGNGIRARLSSDNLGREFDQDVLASAVNFTWTAEASNVSFTLIVDAKSAKAVSSLKNAFSSAITQVGYKVVNSSKFTVEVSVETTQSNKVEGMAGTMYSVNTDIIATLRDKEADNTLGSVKFSGKGLARSQADAVDKAVGNVKINQRDLGGLLQKALH